MKKFTTLGLAVLLLSGVASAQVFGGPIVPALAIPDGTGSCVPGAAAVQTVTVTGGPATITSLVVGLDINHTWYGDVEVTITSPGGTTVSINTPGCAGSLDDSSDLAGLYTISDGAAQGWDAAALAAAAAVPVGSYFGDNPLSAFYGQNANGNWSVTFRDHFPSDTGSVNAVTLDFGICGGGASYLIGQVPAATPGAPLVLSHSCGTPGANYLTAVVIGNPASVPNGWLFGLDIPVNFLLTEINFGAPFFGTLDATGSALFSAPLPAGLQLSSVGIHFDPVTGYPIYASVPGTYTVL